MGIRNIIFRGKRVDNGEWVEGYYLNRSNDKEDIHCIMEKYPATVGKRVIPETVGQFTGLTDKNGKKIFEGDIVKWDEKEWGCPYNELVEFDYELLAMRKYDYEQWCEVIGNIFDDEELLQNSK